MRHQEMVPSSVVAGCFRSSGYHLHCDIVDARSSCSSLSSRSRCSLGFLMNLAWLKTRAFSHRTEAMARQHSWRNKGRTVAAADAAAESSRRAPALLSSDDWTIIEDADVETEAVIEQHKFWLQMTLLGQGAQEGYCPKQNNCNESFSFVYVVLVANGRWGVVEALKTRIS